MITIAPPRHYSPAEYLALEETAESRSEYQNGAIIAMTGGSINHNQIVISLCLLLRLALKTQPSPVPQKTRVFSSDVRLWIPTYNCYTYPDVLVIQGEPQLQDDRSDIVMNPTLIIEVLSKSTRDYDRGEKFKYYRSLPSFAEYLLVDQFQMQVDQFRKIKNPKTTEEAWIFQSYDQPTAQIELSALGISLRMEDIYEDIVF
jgi:Uma2 family endonuclease